MDETPVDALDALLLARSRDYAVLSYWKTLAAARLSCDRSTTSSAAERGAYAGIILSLYSGRCRSAHCYLRDADPRFIFAPQVADAAVRTYEEPVTRGQVMNVASGQEISINRLVREILAVLDIDVPIVYEAPCPGDVRRHRSAIGLATADRFPACAGR